MNITDCEKSYYPINKKKFHTILASKSKLTRQRSPSFQCRKTLNKYSSHNNSMDCNGSRHHGGHAAFKESSKIGWVSSLTVALATYSRPVALWGANSAIKSVAISTLHSLQFNVDYNIALAWSVHVYKWCTYYTCVVLPYVHTYYTWLYIWWISFPSSSRQRNACLRHYLLIRSSAFSWFLTSDEESLWFSITLFICYLVLLFNWNWYSY